jgi:hypothetical protein
MFSNTAREVRGKRFNDVVPEDYSALRNEITLWSTSGAILKGKTGKPGENPCHFSHNKSHMDCPGIEPGIPRWKIMAHHKYTSHIM